MPGCDRALRGQRQRYREDARPQRGARRGQCASPQPGTHAHARRAQWCADATVWESSPRHALSNDASNDARTMSLTISHSHRAGIIDTW